MSSYSTLKKASSQKLKKNEDCESTIAQTEAYESFGLHLYTLRERLGITQRAAASRCDISKAYYGELENSKRSPPPKRRVLQLGAALGASAQEVAFLWAVAQSERLAQRDLPSERPDLRGLVQHLLLRGPSLHPALVDDLLHRAKAGSNLGDDVVQRPEISTRGASGTRRSASPSAVDP